MLYRQRKTREQIEMEEKAAETEDLQFIEALQFLAKQTGADTNISGENSGNEEDEE
jgi:hypothetical protein